MNRDSKHFTNPGFSGTLASWSGNTGIEHAPMANLIRLNNTRRGKPEVFFSRRELGEILSAYSMGVIQGDWRDYAIDRGGHMATFSIFRSSREHPLYSFVKTQKPGQSDPVFALFNGPKPVTSSGSLSTVMNRFRTLPRLVKG
jgi:hypothetical protein